MRIERAAIPTLDAVGPVEARVATAVRDALAVLFPVQCAGCGQPDRALCRDCAARLGTEIAPSSMLLAAAAGERASLPLWFGVEYGGVTRPLLHSLKEAGRADLARALGRILGLALGRALTQLAPTSSVPLGIVVVPSSGESFRRRGYNPVELLVRRSGIRLPRAGSLSLARPVADQAGLGRQERLANLSGAVRASGSVRGRRIILVDDVVTTGATLLECRRAVVAAGGTVAGAASLAHTAKVKGTSSEFGGDFW